MLGSSGLAERRPELFCPYIGHLPGHPNIMLLQDASLMMVAHARGHSYQLDTVDARVMRRDLRNVLFQNVSEPRRIIYEHLVHHQCVEMPEELAYREGFPADWARAYRSHVLHGKTWRNDWFITLIQRPDMLGLSWLNKMRPARRIKEADVDEVAIRSITEAMRTVLATLDEFHPRLLGHRDGNAPDGFPIRYSEIAEAVYMMRTADWQPIEEPCGMIGGSIYDSEPQFAWDAFDLNVPGLPRVGACLSFKNYPARSRPGTLNGLLSANYPVVLYNCFECEDRVTTEAMNVLKRRQMRSIDDMDEEGRDELRKALSEVSKNIINEGMHDLGVTVFASDGGKLDANVGHARKVLLEFGGPKIVRESAGLEAAYWRVMPGQTQWRTRHGRASTKNVADWSSLESVPHGLALSEWGPSTLRLIMDGCGYDLGLHVAGVPHAAMTGRTRSGKAQPLDAKVLTPTGWRRMGDLSVGDFVTTPDGRAVPVTGVYPQGEKEIYRITFHDGRSVECCDDHLWKVWDSTTQFEIGRSHATRRVIPGGGMWKVWPLSKIRTVHASGSQRAAKLAVPLVQPFVIEAPAQDLPVPPYVLGALLGDGSLKNCTSRISTADQHILDRVAAEMPAYKAVHSSRYDYYLTMRSRNEHYRPNRKLTLTFAETTAGFPRVKGSHALALSYGGKTQSIKAWAAATDIPVPTIYGRISIYGWSVGAALGFEPRPTVVRRFSPLAVALKDLGLGVGSEDKFIPEQYKRGSAAQRLALLQGLMDTDGSVGNETHGTFTSTSEQMAKDVQELAWSLGAIAKIASRQTYYKYAGERKPGRPSWRVSIVHPEIGQFFSLPRKVAQCVPKEMCHRLRIVSITKAGTKPAQCISVDHPDHLYVTDNYVVTHNTVLLGEVAVSLEPVMGERGLRVLFDKDRGNMQTVELSGGRYLVLRRGGKGVLAPHKAWVNTSKKRAALYGLYRGLIQHEGYKLDPASDEEGRLMRGIERMMVMPAEMRTMTAVREFLGYGANAAGYHFEKWCEGGAMGWLLANDEHLLNWSDNASGFFGFDFTELMPKEEGLADDGACKIAASVILGEMRDLMDGRRIFVGADECRFYLDIIGDWLDDMSLTGGKREVAVWMAAQYPGHFLQHPRGRSILAQCATKISFPDPGVREEDLVDGFGYTPQAARMVKVGMRVKRDGAGREGARKFLLWRGQDDNGIVEHDLSAMPEHLAVLSAKETSLAVYERARRDDGPVAHHRRFLDLLLQPKPTLIAAE